MNLDELVKSIPDSESTLSNQLDHWIHEWKTSEESIEKLSYLIGSALRPRQLTVSVA
jgi:hypothetical protein